MITFSFWNSLQTLTHLTGGVWGGGGGGVVVGWVDNVISSLPQRVSAERNSNSNVAVVQPVNDGMPSFSELSLNVLESNSNYFVKNSFGSIEW